MQGERFQGDPVLRVKRIYIFPRIVKSWRETWNVEAQEILGGKEPPTLMKRTLVWEGLTHVLGRAEMARKQSAGVP